jgi:hypothetical protein
LLRFAAVNQYFAIPQKLPMNLITQLVTLSVDF